MKFVVVEVTPCKKKLSATVLWLPARGDQTFQQQLWLWTPPAFPAQLLSLGKSHKKSRLLRHGLGHISTGRETLRENKYTPGLCARKTAAACGAPAGSRATDPGWGALQPRCSAQAPHPPAAAAGPEAGSDRETPVSRAAPTSAGLGLAHAVAAVPGLSTAGQGRGGEAGKGAGSGSLRGGVEAPHCSIPALSAMPRAFQGHKLSF